MSSKIIRDLPTLMWTELLVGDIFCKHTRADVFWMKIDNESCIDFGGSHNVSRKIHTVKITNERRFKVVYRDKELVELIQSIIILSGMGDGDHDV